jgi:hypothetical protein
VPTLKKSDVVIISINWSYGPTVASDKELVFSLKEGFSRLQDTPATIVVFGASPAFLRAPQGIAIQQNIAEKEEIYLEAGDLHPVNELLEKVTNGFGYIFFNPSQFMCKKGDFKLCLAKKDGLFLYLDGGHLSETGSIYAMHELWNNHGKQFTGSVH